MNERWETLGGGDHQPAPVQSTPYRPTGLRQAREAAGLHIAALAAALKVPVKKLEALESGRYEELPDVTFARALASSACRHLKIDAAPILEAFPQAHAPMLGARAESPNAPFKAATPGMSFSVLDGLKSPSFVIAALAIVAAAIVALVPDWSQWPGKGLWEQGQAWIETLSAPSPSESSSDAVAKTEADSSARAVQESAVASGGVLDAAPATLKTDTNLADEHTGASASTILHLEATENSWIEVVDGTGKVQVQRMLNKGDALDFSTAPPYSVVLGRADAVKVVVRGQMFDASAYARNSVARFQVK